MRKYIHIAFMAYIGYACQRHDAASEQAAQQPSRIEWEIMRLKDPATGEVPRGIRARELAFAAKMAIHETSARSGAGNWVSPIGPANIGGRTRAFALDITQPKVLIAGGVSGGMWRSTDGGQSWTMTSDPLHLRSVTCLTQDKRPGKQHIWYYGTGEVRGNSAGRGFSAYYEGDGIYQSLDSGKSWQPLPATVGGKPQSTELFDRMWNLAVDASIDTATVIYAATYKHIMRSTDGGQTWDSVLGGRPSGTDTYTDILITPNGAKYATLSSKVLQKGIWRSTDGNQWKMINPPFMPTNFNRIVMAYVPQNPNSIYFFANTPGAGKSSSPPGLGGEYNSLWKYTYLGGDGTDTNGLWVNLSAQLPQDSSTRKNLYTQGCYDQVVAVSPHDSNLVILGGQNIYRNTDAWRTLDSSAHMGGYNPESKNSWDYRYENSHPDFHVALFHPTLPNILYTASDGGIHRTDNVYASKVVWTDLSKGYTTSQFYALSVDRHNPGSQIILGGMQDNSTFWTNKLSQTEDWKMINLGDGSYCAMASNKRTYYSSRQYASMIKEELDADGNVLGFTRIDPQNASAYLFINPFELDPKNDHHMYLGMRGRVMRNTTLDNYTLDSSMDRKSSGWSNVPLTSFPTGAYVTAMHCPRNSGDLLYLGTDLKQFYRVSSPGAVPTTTFNGSSGFVSGGYVSDITTDPRNPMKVLLSFSNYGVHSIWYSENGGEGWMPVAGNLEDPQPAGIPSGYGLGDGPSVRAVEIVPVKDGTVYLAGTSTGLYATTELKGDETVWIKQAPQMIGNALVEAIDSRDTDGFVAIATHGNGVFAGYLTSRAQVDPDAEPLGSIKTDAKGLLAVYPNPATDKLTIRAQSEIAEIAVYNADGTQFLRTEGKGTIQTLSTSNWPKGMMIMTIQLKDGELSVKKVLHK
jgi:photosystem II stability/assembly factor-like uncharacterized protein